MNNSMTRTLRFFLATSFMLAIFAGLALAQSTALSGMLTREQAAAILPTSVFFRGQSATIQGRNSSGIRLAGGKLVLAAAVDTGGYSSSIQESYQAYLITEVPLSFLGKTLPPGAYGFGFVAGGKMIVMDVGGNEVLTAPVAKDAALARPTPLQILADPASPELYRLYLGRTFATFSPQ